MVVPYHLFCPLKIQELKGNMQEAPAIEEIFTP